METTLVTQWTKCRISSKNRSWIHSEKSLSHSSMNAGLFCCIRSVCGVVVDFFCFTGLCAQTKVVAQSQGMGQSNISVLSAPLAASPIENWIQTVPAHSPGSDWKVAGLSDNIPDNAWLNVTIGRNRRRKETMHSDFYSIFLPRKCYNAFSRVGTQKNFGALFSLPCADQSLKISATIRHVVLSVSSSCATELLSEQVQFVFSSLLDWQPMELTIRWC